MTLGERETDGPGLSHPFKKDHILEVDGLRAAAVLLVLWIHLPVGALGERAAALRSTVMAGNLGVDLFFVLSGFLITRILLVERSQGVPVRYFMARRFFRIFPIYYLTIFALLPLLSRNQALAALSYTSNYAQLLTPYHGPMDHAWSLAVEEHFYLLWPPVVAWLSPWASRRVLLCGVLPLAALSLVAAVAFGPWARNLQMMEEFVLRTSSVRFLSLGVGALMAFHESRFRGSRRAAWAWIGVALAAATLLSPPVMEASGAMSLAASNLATPLHLRGFQLALFVVMFPCLGCAALTYAVAWSGSRSPLARVLRAAPLRAIGRISYAIYLYHYPIFQQRGLFGVNPSEPPAVRTALALGLVLLLSSLSYYCVERPLLRLGGGFRVRPTASKGAPAPSTKSPHPVARWTAAALFVALLCWTLQGGAERIVTRGADAFQTAASSEGSAPAAWSLERAVYLDERATRSPADAQSDVQIHPFRQRLSVQGVVHTGCLLEEGTGRLFADLEFLERASAAAEQECMGSGPWARAFVLGMTLAAEPLDQGRRAESAGAQIRAALRTPLTLPPSEILEAAIRGATKVHGDAAFHLPSSWTLGAGLDTDSSIADLVTSFARGLRGDD